LPGSIYKSSSHKYKTHYISGKTELRFTRNDENVPSRRLLLKTLLYHSHPDSQIDSETKLISALPKGNLSYDCEFFTILQKEGYPYPHSVSSLSKFKPPVNVKSKIVGHKMSDSFGFCQRSHNLSQMKPATVGL
jgi:hypothetical protein